MAHEENVTVTLPDGRKEKIPYGIQSSEILNLFNEQNDRILAIKVNNKIYSLDKEIKYDAKIEPILSNSKDGSIIYRRSLCFLLASVTAKLFPNSQLEVGNSLDYGYYYTIENGKSLNNDDINKIENEMKEIVKKNLPISTKFVSYEQAMDFLEKNCQTKTRHQLEFSCSPKVRINMLEDFRDLYYGPLVNSTGILKTFALLKYQDGFLLRFPKSSNPDKLKDFEDQPKLFEIFKKYKDWGNKLGVTSVADLNQLVIDRKINDFIDISETLQEKAIADIADKIVERKKVRVVLISGPSSSGKTTTSKKLALELQALGLKPKVISLDCYYAGRSKTPKDENGNYDYECLEALDIPLLNQNLMDLFDGKEVNIPSYDFHNGTQFFEDKNKMTLADNEILIMEGIHGLNPKLTPKVPSELKFKIYISALTQLNIDDHNRISTSENRLIRRIVRDYQFRGKSAAGTIAMWPSVRNGEEKYIYQFHNEADAILNTAVDYELSVLKIYAEPLLRCVKPSEPEYAEACELLRFLDNFATIDPVKVPPRSILREFIGGSAFKY